MNVGDGILHAMAQYGDFPIEDSRWTTNSDGTTIERCEGLLARYTASNASGGWEVVVEGRNPPPSAAPTALVPAIDVSSHQPADLTQLIRDANAKHVVVHLYHFVEKPTYQITAKAQIDSARTNGCSVGGYCWLFGGFSPAGQVGGSLSLARGKGVNLPVLWLDIEEYPDDGSIPTGDEVIAAVGTCYAEGVQPGIYTRRDIWDRIGAPQLPGVWLWDANWNGDITLNVEPYGGMTVKGHQWTSTPIDQSVFRPEACGV